MSGHVVGPRESRRSRAGGRSGTGGTARWMECGLCGQRFREDRAQPACATCPLSRGCRYVRCPGCGYENPVTPGWLGGDAGASRGGGLGGRLRRWLGRTPAPGTEGEAGADGALRGSEPEKDSEDPAAARVSGAARKDPASVPLVLTQLAPGRHARVAGLSDPGGPDARALAGLGVLPGAAIEVVQRYPAWILRIDHAEIALDDALAVQIRVRPAM